MPSAPIRQPISFAPVGLGIAGAAYGLAAAVMGGSLLLLAYRVIRAHGNDAARRMFHFSILYLVVLFLVLIVERVSEIALTHLA